MENDAWEVIQQLLKDYQNKTDFSKVTPVNHNARNDGADYIERLMSAYIMHSGMVTRDTDTNDLLCWSGRVTRDHLLGYGYKA